MWADAWHKTPQRNHRSGSGDRQTKTPPRQAGRGSLSVTESNDQAVLFIGAKVAAGAGFGFGAVAIVIEGVFNGAACAGLAWKV